MKRALSFYLLLFSVFCASTSFAENDISSINKKFVANDFLEVEPSIIARPWREVPFDKGAFTYSPEEIEAMWPELMRGLQFPFPSPKYLEDRYTHHPKIFAELKNQHTDWEKHSRDTLEVWSLFFSGDFQDAYNMGHELGGFSRIPAIMSEVIYASYLTNMQHEKNMLLQDAANWVAYYAQLFNYEETDTRFHDDYLMIRVGYAYSMARLMEDAPLPKVLSSGVIFKVMEAVDEILAAHPNHPIGLALQASIDANIIRRVGKAAGKITLRTDAGDAKQRFNDALHQVPDMAILRYEYANSLLYINKDRGVREAVKNLEIASQSKPLFAMEELDRLYSIKRMGEFKGFLTKRTPFRKFDKARNKHIRKTGMNMFSIFLPPFNA